MFANSKTFTVLRFQLILYNAVCMKMQKELSNFVNTQKIVLLPFIEVYLGRLLFFNFLFNLIFYLLYLVNTDSSIKDDNLKLVSHWYRAWSDCMEKTNHFQFQQYKFFLSLFLFSLFSNHLNHYFFHQLFQNLLNNST